MDQPNQTRSELDHRLITLARQAGDAAWDPVTGLIAEPAAYNPIHTRIWTGTRHPHRESVLFALTLLETGDPNRAEAVLDVVLKAQDTDDASPTYGIWSYYAEESLAEMAPPDWNWADFLGRDLAFILFRHASDLSTECRTLVETALRHAARSIIRRNVAMSYTNIAAKGTFVTLAAGQLLQDHELTRYAIERVGRLRDQIRDAGSFAEYNSPGYWAITLEAITAIRQYIEALAAVEGAGWIAERLWRHFIQRWHRPTGQLSGPMARSYVDDLADVGPVLAVLAKATGQESPFDAVPLRKPSLSLVVPAILDVAAPEYVIDALVDSPTGQVRERFSHTTAASGHRQAIQGTTWRTPRATLGTANTSEFWLQRRPLLGYWATEDDHLWQQNRHVRLRFRKDDYDFSSAVFSSIQAGGHVLWAVGFISPGGDEHIGLHKIEAGQPFTARSLKLIFEIRDPDATVPGSRTLLPGPVEIDAGPVRLRIAVAAARFGDLRPQARIEPAEDGIDATVELLPGPAERELIMNRVDGGYLVGSFSMIESDTPSDSGSPVEVEVDEAVLTARWTSPAGNRLELSAPARIGTAEQHLAAYRGLVDGVAVEAPPLAR
ncbi:hypothetical protein [Microlunatus parietis]|uniref:Heparinase II/III-like protein n=1 Tax=Microlunatus parietis TaxID=682979 RepID=A0A7Y9LE30_9ACTN|nr:hypothetical protein [Microlunatus parietis]NYE73455.1 hypothetical protein [Microlunatus parietis]